MRRPLALLLVAVVVLSAALAAGAAAQPRDTFAQVTLRVRVANGPWKRSLSVKLRKLVLKDFTLCAIYDHKAGDPYDCEAATHRSLPAGTVLRLEQRPIAKAAKRPDSPGWGMVGLSTGSAAQAIVSNLITGNHVGTFHYRATLRDRASGKVLGTSNQITFIWR